jgi:hypothetical protein
VQVAALRRPVFESAPQAGGITKTGADSTQELMSRTDWDSVDLSGGQEEIEMRASTADPSISPLERQLLRLADELAKKDVSPAGMFSWSWRPRIVEIAIPFTVSSAPRSVAWDPHEPGYDRPWFHLWKSEHLQAFPALHALTFSRMYLNGAGYD